MILKLPISIRSRPWYPNGRKFTEFEARIDFLFTQEEQNPHQIIPSFATKWKWTEKEVSEFIDLLSNTNFKDADWYLKVDQGPPVKEQVLEVIKIYTEVFKRKCGLNDSRARTILARINEGKKMKTRIGTDQFRAVFEFKKKEWTGTEQEKYLTIETLCAAKHFLSYLEAAREDYRKKNKLVTEQKEGVILSGVMFNL